jgi:hypothetical protein
MDLLEIQSKWIDKFYEMQKADRKRLLAAPFLSVPGEPGSSTQFGSILLVGKATAGPWCLDKFLSGASQSLEQQVENRRDVTKRHLEFMKDLQPSAFWRFWKALSAISSPVIWTNLAKIGVVHGNPSGAYLSAQQDLACETLRAEICEYNPSLVVIAGDFAKNQIVFPAFGVPRSEWHEPTEEFCWLDRTASRPAVLWTNHPERKPRARIRCWLEMAQKLVTETH